MAIQDRVTRISTICWTKGLKKPAPVPGLVIRYDFLWRDEAEQGRIEGAKERPCAVVIVVPQNEAVERIVVAPITHTPPVAGAEAIEVPARVKRHLGLDDARSWIIPDQLNRVRWDDPGIVPTTETTWTYGALPQPLVAAIQARVKKLATMNRLSLEKRK